MNTSVSLPLCNLVVECLNSVKVEMLRSLSLTLRGFQLMELTAALRSNFCNFSSNKYFPFIIIYYFLILSYLRLSKSAISPYIFLRVNLNIW